MFKDSIELKNYLAGIVEFDGDVNVIDPIKLRDKAIDELVYNAVFNPDENLKMEIRNLIRKIARSSVLFLLQYNLSMKRWEGGKLVDLQFQQLTFAV